MTTFSPVRWKPERAPGLTGAFAENDRLAAARLIRTPHDGPEDVAVAADGTVYAGTDEGSILRLTGDGTATVVANVGGRPLGVELYGDDLLVCNAYKGLQRVSQSGTVEVLTDRVDGTPLTLTNNATVASDGTIYFTESSQRWELADYTSDILEAQATGRLLRRTPDGEVTVLATGLSFANGVALDPTESSLFVAETGRYRIHRHWLSGDRAGEQEIFADNLPGFPDNLSVSDGTLWGAFASPRNPQLDVMGDKPWLKHVAQRLPDAIRPKAIRHGFVFGMDMTGTVTHNLQDPSGRIAITTSARVANGSLYVGMLEDPHVAVVEL